LKLTLGFSPCPNDTFIFDALVNRKIDTGGLDFEVLLEDVETLNEWALTGRLDITKLSFPAFFRSLDKYVLLDSGSALGKGVGPLLVSKSEPGAGQQDVERSIIALPGQNTTANLLFSLAYPGAWNKNHLIFSDIEDAVLDGRADLGVIIHENRFTYGQRGLHKLMDLGEYWEREMNLPIPLGGIAAKRTIEVTITRQVETLIRKSIEFAYANYPAVPAYVKQHSQTMSDNIMRQHIGLYVNSYSVSLGNAGREAIEKLREVFIREDPSADMKRNDLFL
jgi:1,4-dihydroxy-6-naphthoate synthase